MRVGWLRDPVVQRHANGGRSLRMALPQPSANFARSRFRGLVMKRTHNVLVGFHLIVGLLLGIALESHTAAITYVAVVALHRAFTD
jgi:hypothetical protein